MSAESEPADKLIGQVLAERYLIQQRLGEGAMGAVYKARHVKVGRPFAVKVLHARLLQDPKVELRFAREAELAGRLRHPNVVGVVDVGEIDGMRYMVMDFVEGPDLAHLLDEAPMRPERIIHLVRQMLEGLYHAHECGLIHRDFKPENVIVERDTHGAEVPRIVDFGIALLRDGDAGDPNGRLTTNGLVLGTPHYMAPEQAVADPIDHRIDLFALGIVVYEMLSGRLPFDGSGAEVARANLLVDPPPIKQRVPYLEVDPLLEAFARRLMAKKRNARPPTAKAARELLDLIERDRRAAAAALGVAVSERGGALTEPVGPQVTPAAWSPDAATTRMKPTPPANLPSNAAVESPAARPLSDLAIAGGAALGAEAQRPTMLRTPLSWETAPIGRRRRPWLIVGLALGAAGITAGWIAATSGSDDEPGARVVMTPVRPAPPPPSARPTTPPTVVVDTPAPPAPVLTTADLAPAPPARKVEDRKLDTKIDRRPSEPRPSEPRPSEPRHTPAAPKAEPRVEAKAPEHKPEPKPEPKPAEHAAEAKPAEPRADPALSEPPTGLTAKQLSDLWVSVGQQLGRLPSGSADDLWTRFRVFKIQALMAAPSPERDAAAKQLWQIHQDAAQRR